MLTAKENMREVIRGGNPDRFVNQYEAVSLLFHPYLMTQPLLQKGMENVVNGWGVTQSFPTNAPGAFPVHTRRRRSWSRTSRSGRSTSRPRP